MFCCKNCLQKLQQIESIIERIESRKIFAQLCKSYICECDELLNGAQNEMKDDLYFRRMEKIVETTQRGVQVHNLF
jgi:hypothetical protein